ncbi:MAG: 4-(cytidine 5'-diphospho)-2-C-methyl-D-erythritol kinase [Chitinivibrionales bacterium]|nr:4-(cytidine 5'-diphospho)-2-C-methyl-D-erythritol kinase [Chitinivibrionales bacterium]MBD3358648.1 4-(cytidine 5'-diphospho)-2-C-methyl-D-erythritol kinase [Chitinivibrionales bacterium]
MKSVMGTVAGRSYTRVTLALDIIGRLTEGPWAGYHRLGIVKKKIDLFDDIVVEESAHDEIVCDRPDVPRDSSNLCWKAAEEIRRASGVKQPVRINIEKHIPLMGGLAGGSANAATVMMLLSSLWSLELSTQRLCELGRRVGMDVPFYFVGDTAFDTETGTWPQLVGTSLTFTMVLALPPFGVSTSQAYAGIDYRATGHQTGETEEMLDALKKNDGDAVIARMHNDFEHSVFASHPALVSLRAAMLNAGCRKVVLSGSGSTLIGVVDDTETARVCAASVPTTCIVASTNVPGMEIAG